MTRSISKYFVASILTLSLVGFSFAQDAVATETLPTPPKQADSTAVVAETPVEELVTPRGATEVLDEMIQAKLDSIDAQAAAVPLKQNTDSLAKARADSVRKLILEGKYVKRARYDKSNFDHWKKDTVFQKAMKELVFGVWPEIRFGMNDTIYGVTRTYSDSGRYQMTGEYAYKARYQFDSDTSLITREVFKDRQVIRWDFTTFKIMGDTLRYNLNKLEFRDLNDNWLNALQGFENVPPEFYYKDPAATSAMQKELEKKKK